MISVIISLFNAEKFISRAIDSLLTLFSFSLREVIIEILSGLERLLKKT